MQAISGLASRRTVILVAHRLTTLKNCDCIYIVDEGRIADAGTFKDLSERSHLFKDMGEFT